MKKYLKAICLFITILLLLGGLIINRYKILREQNLQRHETSFHSSFNSISHTFRLVSQTIVNEILRQHDTLKLVHSLVTTDDEQQRNHLRGLLFRQLMPMYQRISQHSVRQLHFHFPDNRSMLRMHKPTASDDDLSTARPSVVIANKQHQEVHGYESGRIIHGFRHVYPLSYEGTHIGSVEVSNSFQQLRHELIKYAPNSDTDYLFIMLKSDLWHKLAAGQQELYRPSEIHPDYLRENADSNYYNCCGGTAAVSPSLKKIKQQLGKNPKLPALIQTQQDFALSTFCNRQLYAVLFHSIKNVDGEHAAYTVSIHPEPALMELKTCAIIQFAIAVLFAGAVVIYRFKLAQNREEKQNISEFLHNITSNMGEGLYTTDINGKITFINHEATRLLGYSSDETIAQNAHVLFHSKNEQHNNLNCVMLSTIINNQSYRQVQANFRHKDQHEFPVEVTCTPIEKQGKVVGTITLFHNISERRKREAQLQSVQESLRRANLELKKQAHIDGLTGISNRRYFDQMLQKIWHIANRHQQPLSIIMIDIDHFKLYNDHYGHLRGDQCLKQVATIIRQSCMRPDDIVARYGGEEFIVTLPNTSDRDALGVAQRICTNTSKAHIPHSASPTAEIVTLSAGVCSLQPTDDNSAKNLIDCADRRLYAAKRNGRNQVCSSNGNPSEG